MEQERTSVNEALPTERITLVIGHLMRGLSRHWLAVASVALGLFIGLPLLAPVLMEAGYERLGNAIHTLFYVTCHQLPERSYFLFGPQWIYSRAELLALTGEPVSLRFVGNQAVGYKMAVCQRDTAIYGGWFLWGLLFGLVRDRLKPISVRTFILLLVPMAVDGGGQLVGLWSSTWLTRLVTGLLFGLAVVLLAYPYLEQGMADMAREAEEMLASGRGA
jgi:uncharacterized membrane protein